MPRINALIVLALLTLPAAALADAKFTRSPSASADGREVKIAFAVSEPTDVQVSIVDATGAAVRHLAARRLEADELSQTLTWDRTDDAGKPVVGDFKVRVGLGLGGSVVKHVGFDPFTFRNIVALAVNGKGEVFMLDSENTYGASQWRVFSRDGKYLRTVMPYSASLPAERTASIGQLALADGTRLPIVYNGHGQNLSPYTSGMKPQTPAFDGDGNLVFFSAVGTIVEHAPPRFLLRMDGQGGAPKAGFIGPPIRAAIGMLGGAGEGGTHYFDHLAISPDGEFIYFTTRAVRGKNTQVVYRVRPADTELPKPWLGELGKAGDDQNYFDNPQGVAVDKAGRVFVADRNNNRVMVFSADGKPAGSFPADSPEQLFINPAGGEIYVTSVNRDARNRPQSWSLRKLSAWKTGEAPKVVADMKGLGDVLAAVDFNATPVQLWLASTAKFGQDVTPVIDRGRTFDVGKGLGRLAGLRQPMFVAADAPHGKVYVTEFRNRQRQFDLKTSEMTLFATGGEAAVDRDGFVYIIEGYRPVFIHRYDRDGKPANYPGTDTNKLGPLDTASKGPDVGFRGHVVAPNGDIYLVKMQFYGHGRVSVFSPDGKLKSDNLVDMIPNGSGGLAVDRQGNVFVSANVKPADAIYPPDFADLLPKEGWRWWRSPRKSPWDRPYYNAYLYHWASVFKFGPEGGKFYPAYKELGQGGRDPVEIPKEATVYKLGYLNFDVGVTGAKWRFHGFGPVPTAGLNWGDPSCVCMGARFAVDDFGRLFVPDAFRFTVNVLDPDGRLITRIGKYGNADDPGISLAWGVYCSTSGGQLFIGDMANRRVSVVDLTAALTAETPVPAAK